MNNCERDRLKLRKISHIIIKHVGLGEMTASLITQCYSRSMQQSHYLRQSYTKRQSSEMYNRSGADEDGQYFARLTYSLPLLQYV